MSIWFSAWLAAASYAHLFSGLQHSVRAVHAVLVSVHSVHLVEHLHGGPPARRLDLVRRVVDQDFGRFVVAGVADVRLGLVARVGRGFVR